MIERYILAASADLAGSESSAATRERLRDAFPRGATRRMTQLGLLVGSVLQTLAPGEEDPLIYASTFAENQALEAYLSSFPTPSPTLFQTSIHPSAVQQALIARQQAVREVFPLTGNSGLAASALELAAAIPGKRVLLCGGEERGASLRELGLASEDSFAFALALSAEPDGAIGQWRWKGAPAQSGENMTLIELARCVGERRSEMRAGMEFAWL